MKKILIVNNNMKIGGVQKSLCNLLWAIDGKYDVTLLLFHRSGALLSQLPPSVKVVECDSAFRFFGMSQAECKEKIKRGALAFVGKKFGRNRAIKLMRRGQKPLPDQYDVAIAYLHNGNPHHFYGGVQDFVLHAVKADRRVAFLHCDYRLSDANHRINNDVIAQFDRIAACSEGCKRAFLEILPELEEKCVVVRNCHRFERIFELAEQDTVQYPEGKLHILTVARLAHEKGVERAIAAVAALKKKGVDFCLHIVGSGAMLPQLQELARVGKLPVEFHGEQENPYRFMKNADLLLLTSYYEAAPMVLQEAAALSLPVLTTETISTDEMVVRSGIGFVCENAQKEIDRALSTLASEPSHIAAVREKLRCRKVDNSAALQQFQQMLED